VQQAREQVDLCPVCEDRVAALEHAALTPIVVAAFAEFLHDRDHEPLKEPSCEEAAHRFWAALTIFGDVVDRVSVAEALDELARCAPSQVDQSRN
jgi:hypothetical protein